MKGAGVKEKILDGYCTKIISTLVVKEVQGKRKIRFNELHNTLETLGIEMSKPTLSQHLKHLTKEKLVIRNVEDVQNVTYKINEKKFGKAKEFIASVLEWETTLKEEKEKLFSLPVEEQITEIVRLSALVTLSRLKHRILYETGRKLEDGFMLMGLDSPLFRRQEAWIADKAVNDAEYKKTVLQGISGWSDKFRGVESHGSG